MKFYELQEKLNSYNKPDNQPCDPVQVVSCAQDGKLYGQTTYYQMVVKGAGNVDMPASLASQSGPITPGTHQLMCQVKMGQKGRQYTFKAGRSWYGSPPPQTSQPSQGRSDDLQQRITWNSAVNNAVIVVANSSEGFSHGVVEMLAEDIYKIIMRGPQVAAEEPKPNGKQYLKPVADELNSGFAEPVADEDIYQFAFDLFGKYPSEPLNPAAVEAAATQLMKAGIVQALGIQVCPF